MKTAAPDEHIGPCAGFRVLDFSTMVSGPLAGQNLGDLGADVIKIETMMGDISRWMGPPERAGINGFFSQLNRNKRAISIDLKQEEGQRIAQRLARDADVVLENFRPGVAERPEEGEGFLLLGLFDPREHLGRLIVQPTHVLSARASVI